MSTLADALGSAATVDAIPPPSFMRRYGLALAVLTLLIALSLIATWKHWLPSTAVQVVRVESIAQQTDARAAASTGPDNEAILFQAAGWIEPDPYAHHATAFVSGIIEQVHVVEGQAVQAGDMLATIDSSDYQIALDASKADLAIATANVHHAEHSAKSSPSTSRCLHPAHCGTTGAHSARTRSSATPTPSTGQR